MEYLIHVRRCYANALNALAQQEQRLRRERGRQKKVLEQQINTKVETLFQQIRQDFPSPLSRTLAITALYQELGLVSESAANKLRAGWQQSILQAQDEWGERIQAWNLDRLANACEKPESNLAMLPTGSWFLQFDFRLAKPYLSHDDEALYLIDNPVSKDHVLGLPLIRPSSWKGNLRSALRLLKGWACDDQPELNWLLGNPKGAESDFRAGRLECYPTFFREVGLEIINPHDRARRVGKNPILMECVPTGATGTFSLLYVPFDLIGQPNEAIIRQAKADLQIIAEAIGAMMLTYGFSAKRTSGYGTAEDNIAGMVKTRAGEKPLTHLTQLAQEVQDVRF